MDEFNIDLVVESIGLIHGFHGGRGVGIEHVSVVGSLNKCMDVTEDSQNGK